MGIPLWAQIDPRTIHLPFTLADREKLIPIEQRSDYIEKCIDHLEKCLDRLEAEGAGLEKKRAPIF